MPQSLLVATRNPGKIRELRRLLINLPVQLLSLDEAGVMVELSETGTTFAENAIEKAEQARDLTGLLTLAEDSGLCVDALHGAPGVYSARYGGPGLTDRQRLELLLKELDGVPAAQRSAQFVAVAALARPGQATITTTGSIAGVITDHPIGNGGFGYDPIFLVPELGTTTAALTDERKNLISHRGRAIEAMLPHLRKALDSLQG